MPKGLLRGFLGGLATGVGKGAEAAGNQYYVQQVVDNPNMSPVQKAAAISSVAPEFSKQYLKNAEEQSQLQEFLGSSQQAPPSRIPQGQERYAAMQSQIPTAEIPGIGVNAPPQPGMQQQQVQQQAPAEGDIFSNLSDSKLKEGIARFGKNPAIANAMKEELADRRAEKKLDKQEEHVVRQERMQIHRDLSKADKEVHDEAKTARRRISSFNVMRKNLTSGKLDPTSFKNVVTTTLKGTRWENLLKSPERAEFEAAALSSFEGMKDLFGTRLSDADLRQAAGKVPDPTKSVEANEAIINFMEFQDKMKIAEEKIGAEIKRENGGFRPLDYQEQIRDRMQQEYGDAADEITKRAAYDGSDKPKFDPSNQEHNARRMQVLEQVGGDKVKANQILQQEFMR